MGWRKSRSQTVPVPLCFQYIVSGFATVKSLCKSVFILYKSSTGLEARQFECFGLTV